MATIYNSGRENTLKVGISNSGIGYRKPVDISNGIGRDRPEPTFQGVMGEQQLLRNLNVIDTWTTTLENGNAVVIYTSYNVDYGYMQIIDGDGNKILDHTAFNTFISNWKVREYSVASLDNGNYVIQWKHQLGATTTQAGKFAIFDATGSKVVNDVTYHNNRLSFPIPKQMSNGNIALSMNDQTSGDQDSEYKVYNITGSSTGDSYIYHAGYGHQDKPILSNVSNGNLMILWGKYIPQSGQYALTGQTVVPNNTLSQSRTIDTSTDTDNGPAGKSAELVDGNIAFMYAGSSFLPTIRILDQNLQDVLGETIISEGTLDSLYNGDCVPLDDGRFLVVWRSAASSHYSGSFKIFSADGTVSSSATTIATSSVTNIRATKIGNDKVIVTYEADAKLWYKIIS